jgi:hypothetical protein
MLREDNSGFVHFPLRRADISKMDTGKTMIYIAVFDIDDINGGGYDLSNIQLDLPGSFISDDVNKRPVNKMQLTIDDIIDEQTKNDEYDSFYFPNIRTSNTNRTKSITMISCVCIGWSEYSFECRNQIGFWNANFNDLTNEGRKLYYSLKKLNNNKEIRILTFNNI